MLKTLVTLFYIFLLFYFLIEGLGNFQESLSESGQMIFGGVIIFSILGLLFYYYDKSTR